MSGLHRADRTPDPAPPAPSTTPSAQPAPSNTPSAQPASAERQDGKQIPPTTHVPRTRVGAAWLGICATALAFVVLIIFMLQNTRSTEVTFLGWRGTLPLALALLIAAVGSAILTMAIGTARITQLRRLSAKRLPQTRR